MGTVTTGIDARLANRQFLVFNFLALWLSTLGARVPESQKSKNCRLASLASNPLIGVAILGTLS